MFSADSAKADSVFSGISTFGRLPYYPCLASDDVKYDIAFIGTCLHVYAQLYTHQADDTDDSLQGLRSTQELHIDRAPALALLESVKVLAVSIFSQSPQAACKLISCS
jgi:hypothetical protein